MAKTKEDIVTFLNSKGEEISNDPRWLARKTLQASGMDDSSNDELEALKAQLAEANARAEAAEARAAEADQDGVEEDDSEDESSPYANVKGKELAALAKERGIELTKGMKAGDVRAALAAQDNSQE